MIHNSSISSNCLINVVNIKGYGIDVIARSAVLKIRLDAWRIDGVNCILVLGWL